ncbi:glycosyltransferase family 4 protein [Rubellicoccus peritrichatus]|uniref:Glycosyltransferase family 4 protein n=1 Tax=Rubellicoccus peritrichatus TaxID=3080537 RepID=A0AAQ3LB37_9BACT|nr:glycosyltransferase family 4 protein [Puniceicoccus sp. CR14]WOO42027.1 glycosyltransferase family 4 protein [Puniceicoccus sp. CR14]
MSQKPRILVIAEAANPELTSVALIGYSLSQALRGVASVHLVTELRNNDCLLKAGLSTDDFTAIDNRAAQGLAFKVAKILRGGNSLGWTIYSAFANLAYPLFEKKIWQQFGDSLKRGDYDLVHRITPLSPTSASPLAKHLARINVPFVIGPLNGGIPWPDGFNHLRRAEREWLSYIRGLYKLTPGLKYTRRSAAAILLASRHTFNEVTDKDHALRSKAIYLPENAIDSERFPEAKPMPTSKEAKPLSVAFIGRLVPYKGADIVLEAAASLIREGKLTVDIIGDGDEMPRLKSIVAKEKIEAGVDLPGWVPHEKLGERLSEADIFAFPSVREFGGGVVLEAMALGLCPIVADYGGPAELIPEGCGFKLPMGNRENLLRGLNQQLATLCDQPDKVNQIGARAMRFARENFTWEAKASQIRAVYDWVLSGGDKPDWGMPFKLSQCA